MRWKNPFRAGPPAGTSENPEIIDPRLPPRQRSALNGRLVMALQLLFGLLIVSLPAALFGSAWSWLFNRAVAHDEILAWIFLVLISPPTLLFVAFALIADLTLLTLLMMTLLGKRVVVWGKFPNLGR